MLSRRSLALLTALLALTPLASALLVGLSYPELWRGSDFVLLGKVGSTRDTKLGYRLHSVTVERYYKGAGPTVVSVEEEGGDMGGGMSLWVEDQPELKQGQRYLLFLTLRDGFLRVYGGPQGALTVTGDEAETFNALIRLTAAGVEPVKAENVRVDRLEFRGDNVDAGRGATVFEPARFTIWCTNLSDRPGYKTFKVQVASASGSTPEPAMEVTDYVGVKWQTGVPFEYNFTAPGLYRVTVDGSAWLDVEVKPPRSRVELKNLLVPSAAKADKCLEVGFEVARFIEPGEHLVVLRVSPSQPDWPTFYRCYPMSSDNDSPLRFHVEIPKAGDYTLSVWQGGVKQLSQKVTVTGLSREEVLGKAMVPAESEPVESYGFRVLTYSGILLVFISIAVALLHIRRLRASGNAVLVNPL